MKMILGTGFFCLMMISFSSFALSQFPAACDPPAMRSCLGNALTLTVTSGKGSHYVDVANYSVRDRSQTAMTFEAWIKPERQAGLTQFIAGLWGPSTDNNDVWVAYIDASDNIVLEINGDGTKLRQADNTVATAPGAATQLYGQWNHIALMFDGNTGFAFIYLNGKQIAAGRNNQYPASYLRPLEKQDLPLQIGSCNGISDNTTKFRTFKGQMDEIRYWNKIIPDAELECNRFRSRNGNEAGLTFYYRCNENANVFTLCDATGKNNQGRMRSGASCQKSDRDFPQTIIASVARIEEEIQCASTKTWDITIEDTSICGNNATIRITGRDQSSFSVSQTSAALAAKTPVTFQLRFNSVITGSIIADLRIRSTNACGKEILIPLRLTRTTELRANRSRINFDTLYLGCRQREYRDTIIQISNSSDLIGAPRPVTITQFRTATPTRFFVVGVSLPLVIPSGSSSNVTVRFASTGSIPGEYFDTLSVVSDDRCPGGLNIPLRGVVRQVMQITDPGGTRVIDSMKFGTVCVGQLSNPALWVWKNLTARNVYVDAIIAPQDFTMTRMQLPFVIEPNRGYNFNVVRFFPQRSGQYRDSIVFLYRIDGLNCTLERKIYVTGTGFLADIEWSVTQGDAGTVIVGQESTFTVRAKNNSPDDLRVSFYVQAGEVFFLNGLKSATIPRGQFVDIPVTFKPLQDSVYLDKLCLFEQRCYTSACIPITGRGILETFRFQPIYMRTENTVACLDQIDTLDIVNLTDVVQTMSLISLSDPSGKFTVVSPNPIPPSITISPKDYTQFIFRYTPNDITQDRADKAFLRYENQGVEWSAPLLGTSATPKLYVTPLTTFGSVEVGDIRYDTVLIENVSILPVRVDRMNFPNGMTELWTSRPWGSILQPRDSMLVAYKFEPIAEQSYNGQFTVYSDSLCPISKVGSFEARGVILQLQAPVSLMNWGYVRPCDCITREIPLINESLVHPMTIDNLLFDTTNVPNATPQFWQWSSAYSPNGTLPIIVPPDSRDTLRLVFCPRTPAETQYVDCATRMKFSGKGPGWSKTYETYLLGKRALLYKPEPTVVAFPPTRVDTLSTPRYPFVSIPPITVNPDQEEVIIDSISFEPEERVFLYRDTQNRPFPIRLQSGDTLRIRVDFKPRAPRQYTAKMRLHTSKPCIDIDTTILVSGSAFAPAFGLNFAFDNQRSVVDTFVYPSCDTIRIPIYSSRDVPARLVDILCRVGYDTTELRYVGAESVYLSNSKICEPRFLPKITAAPGPGLGTSLALKNFCSVDSLQPFVIAKFISKTGNRSTTKITVDSINFDTEETILYKIIAGNDDGRIIIQKTDLTILNPIIFDSVRVLDCKEAYVSVKNSGDMPIIVDSLPGLPKSVAILGSVPPNNIPLPVDSIIIFHVRFCPVKEDSLSGQSFARTIFPCTVLDSTLLSGFGYAPDLYVQFGASPDFSLPTEIRGTLGDTITVGIYCEKDIAAEYLGTKHWLRLLNFDLNVQYNHRMLKYLSGYSPYNAKLTSQHGNISAKFEQIDSLTAGKIAEYTFLVVVPDTLAAPMTILVDNFSTSALAFLDVFPIAGAATCYADGECNVSTVKFSHNTPNLLQSIPNPAHDFTVINFEVQETAPAIMRLYSIDGKLVKHLLNEETILTGGKYSLPIDLTDIESGVYYYQLESGVSVITRTLVIAR